MNPSTCAAPIVLPLDLKDAELNDRMVAARDYRIWAKKQGLDKHVVSDVQMGTWLARSGYPAKWLKVFVGEEPDL